jgi:hypothetical protein
VIDDDGVESNARMTGVLGAVLLVALAIEGVTVPAVRQMLTLHVFMGFFVVPVVGLKLATTGYRFFRYYQGAEPYRRKGPPHPVLRVVAPLVVISTVALLATGIVMLAVGPRHSDTWRTLHQASFIAWFAFMTIHVLGHAFETWRLTVSELNAKPRLSQRRIRIALAVGSVAIGLALAIASTGWIDAWKNRPPEHARRTTPELVLPHR